MKILILDVYPDKPYRISKDQNGAMGLQIIMVIVL